MDLELARVVRNYDCNAVLFGLLKLIPCFYELAGFSSVRLGLGDGSLFDIALVLSLLSALTRTLD